MGIKILSLSKNEDFKKILSGKRINNRYSTIFFNKLLYKNNSTLNISVVTKKKLGKAVQRNKIKRRLKNIINYILKSIKINLKYSYLIIAKKNVLDSKYNNIKETLLVDFKKILTGRRINNYYSTIFYKKITSKQHNILNISIITKKKLGKAVQRNKIKRRLKNIVNNILKSVKINLKYSYLIIAKKNVLDSKYNDIKETILKDFKKIL